MMLPTNFLSILIVVLLGGILAYNISFLKNKKILHLSLLQVIYLVIIPGTIFVILYSYVRSLIGSPRVEHPFLPDTLLVNSIFLSALFAYGGVSVHAVTKMLAEAGLRNSTSEVAQLNKFFHLSFSHNLVYSGSIFMATGLTLLELNHSPGPGYSGWKGNAYPA